MAEVVIGQLADRLQKTDLGKPLNPEQAKGAAQVGITLLRQRVESWGEQGLLRRVPPLAEFGLPRSKQGPLDASARVFLCLAVYEVMHARAAFATAPPDARLEAAMASASLNLAVLYLRHRFLAGGGTDDQLQAFVTGADAEAALGRIQDRPPLLDRAFGQCRPLVAALIADE
jgi:hypothetical protein